MMDRPRKKSLSITATALLLLLQIACTAADQASVMLFTAGGITNGKPTVEYGTCTETKATAVAGKAMLPSTLANSTVNARWFGGTTAKASQFSVSKDCRNVTLAGKRSVQVYKGTAAKGCQWAWLGGQDYVHLKVTITGTKDTCCGAGSPATETDPSSGAPLLYGLQATWYPNAYDCSNSNPSQRYTLPDFSSLKPDDTTPSRCNDAMNIAVYGGAWPGSPPLDPAKYSKCFGVRLSGYVNVVKNDALTWETTARDESIYHKFRVCVRYNQHAKVMFGEDEIVCPDPGDYDASLVCRDYPSLPFGLTPLTIEYAADPTAQNTILQMWIIPIGNAYLIANPTNPAQPWGYDYHTYMVDTSSKCSDIALYNNLTLEQLLAYNPGLDCANMPVGKGICISPPPGVATSVGTPAPTARATPAPTEAPAATPAPTIPTAVKDAGVGAPNATDCCLYAVNMAYYASSALNGTRAATSKANVSIAIVCTIATSGVVVTPSDLTVQTSNNTGTGKVTGVYDITDSQSGRKSTSYLAQVSVADTYTGDVKVFINHPTLKTVNNRPYHSKPGAIEVIPAYQ
ncbi:hypothetical protein WJX72_009907 [[Myrmecia] bisecta]|uniref:LysM domain-containing protein n=1 Tax=[Myrmecia] bisecta TaxID=41462 RepID=A0AAW1R930_9CHLO